MIDKWVGKVSGFGGIADRLIYTAVLVALA